MARRWEMADSRDSGCRSRHGRYRCLESDWRGDCVKNWHLPVLALLFSAMWFGIQPQRVAFASDISNATFYGLVQITNNDTVSHVSTSNITNIYTSSMISGGYIAANATNIVMRDATNAA